MVSRLKSLLSPSQQKQIVGVVLLFLTLPPCIEQFSYWVKQVLEDDHPTLWQDESVSTEAMLSIYNNGYSGYRCDPAAWGPCYGIGMPLIDATANRLASNSWLEKKKILIPPGKRWIWFSEFPRMGQLMLGLRLTMVLALLGYFFISAVKTGKDLYSAALFTSGLSTSYIFINSWAGIKNDFPMNFFLVLYFIVLNCGLSQLRHSKRLALVAIAAVIGIYSGMIKPSALPIVAVSLCWLPLIDRLRQLTWKQTLIRSLLILATLLVSYIALNPNLFANSLELNWLQRIFTLVIRDSWGAETFAGFIAELRLFLLASPPLFLGIFLLYKNRSEKALLESAPLLSALFFVLLLNLKSRYGRIHYHLPILILGTQFLLTQTRTYASQATVSWKQKITASLLIVIAINLPQIERFIHPIDAWVGIFSEKPRLKPSPLTVLGQKIADSSRLWFIDINTRIPIPKTLGTQIEYFESWTETPKSVMDRIRSTHSMDELKNSGWIIPCWENESKSKQSPEFQWLHYSPVATQWSDLVSHSECQKLERNGVYGGPQNQFGFVWSIKNYVEMNFDAIAKRIPRTEAIPPANPSVLSTRLFNGSHFGSEYGTAQFFQKSFHLSQTFEFKPGLVSIEIQAQSNCKSESNLRLRFFKKGSSNPEQTIDMNANVSSQFEGYFSNRLHGLLRKIDQAGSRLGFSFKDFYKKWSKQSFELKKSAVTLHIPKSTPIQISLDGTLPKSDEEWCWIAIEPLSWENK